MPHPTLRVLTPPMASRLTLRLLLVLVVVFALARVLFFAMYGGAALDLDGRSLIQSFLIGTRFDLGAVGLVFILWVLFAHLPFIAGHARRLRGVALPIAVLLGVIVTLTALGDCVYYGYAGKRISYEPMVMTQVGSEALEFAFGEHPILMPASVVAILGLWAAAWWWLRRSVVEREPDRIHVRTRSAVWGLLLLGVFFVFIRGSLNGGRLRIGDAYHCNDVVINHATLNPIFTCITSALEDRDPYDFMPYDEAVRTVRETIGARAGGPESAEFPMLQTSVGQESFDRLNVVLLLMESLSAYSIGAFGDPNGATPCLDRIIEESVLFDRFLASGSRSSNGMIATLCSVPAQLGRPVTHSSLMLDNFHGIANILTGFDYETTFLYGGVYDFSNAPGFLKNTGFQTIIAEPLDPDIERRTWGYDDEHMFDRLLHELRTRSDRPQFMTLFTQNLHGRKVPKEFVRARGGLAYPKSMDQDKYYNLLLYTDWCLGRFFDAVAKEPFFDRTVFLIVSDHTNHKSTQLFESRHIPFIIHAPKILAPARHRTIGGQCDVLPTLLGLLGIPAEHASFGQDLLAAADRGDEGRAYFTVGGTIGWAEGSWIAHDIFDRDRTKLYDIRSKKNSPKNVAAEHPELARSMAHRARAYLQLSRTLLVENRLATPPVHDRTE